MLTGRPPGEVRDTLWSRAAVLLGLTGFAITQPLLDLFGRNPEFFVSGRYSAAQIVAFGVVVALVPSLLAFAVVAVTGVVPRAGTATFVVLVAALAAAVSLAVTRTLGYERLLVAIPVAAVAAAVVVYLERRTRPGRLLLRYLAVANPFFLLSFLLFSPTAELVSTSEAEVGDLGEAAFELDGPVVVIVVDEFPVTSIMRQDGDVDGELFPAFAELAQHSTWFRNASSRRQLTPQAVPDLLTGVLTEKGELPTFHDHPRNLLTMFGREVPVRRYEIATDLCPPSICDPPPSPPLRRALSDALVVYGHRVLPARWRQDLPRIDHSWGGFGDDLAAGAAAAPREEADSEEIDPYERWRSAGPQERSAATQLQVLRDAGTAIDGSPAVHLIHVAVPHFPWTMTPWGRLMEVPQRIEDPAHPAFEWSARLQFQMHLMQAGAVDAALGDVIDHLQATGAWDATTLAVVSDHGTSLLPPDFGRELTDNSREETLRTLMFIKAPGQNEGEQRDEVAMSVDLLPSLADVLDVESNWEFDGHSLFDGSERTVDPYVSTTLDPALDLVARHREGFPNEGGWTGLASVGEHGDLVGREVSELEIGPPARFTWEADHQEEFSSLPAEGDRVPQVLTGLVWSPERPPELVVEVNGTLAGTIGGYEAKTGAWRFTGMMGPYFRDGANEVNVYQVERAPSGQAILHPLQAR